MPVDRPKLPTFVTDEDRTDETNAGQEMAALPADSGEIALQFTSRPYLIIMRGPAQNQVFPLAEGETVIGRERGSCDVLLVETSMSRRHAKIFCEGGDYFIEDLGSANGTFLNGARIEGKYRLTTGDRLRLGNTVLMRFEWPTNSDMFSDEEPPTSASVNKLRAESWSAESWRVRNGLHLPKYDNPALLETTTSELRRLPPLVTSSEIERLKSLFAEAQRGERFLLQGGDCAETFADCAPAVISNKLKILLQMSLVLTHAARKPVIRVGRFAGQYAKPRSKPTEIRDGRELPSYVGDLVNRPEFTDEARRPDPRLLMTGYLRAGLTLNFIRSLCAAGFSRQGSGYLEIPQFERDDMPAELRAEYARMKLQVQEGLHFLRAMGDQSSDGLSQVEFFASHEGLNLEYESAQTRQVPGREGWYCQTTHLPWIGERTRALNGAHIEFFRGVENPIGIKVGPSMTSRELIDLLRILNPKDEPGKILLIIRMGAGVVPTKLPPLIEAVKRSRRAVLWVSDPMHGNGMVTKSGIKTRDFSKILQEVEETFDTHEKCESILGGVHFELTAEDVTECLGAGLTESDLDLRYLTACDPRLNYRQAMEMTFCIARRIAASSVRRASKPPPSAIR
jgi:3-deoxy-7-phosphoheptulonate synthase